MDRKAWLDERRRVTEEVFDRDTSTYDAGDVPITPTHRRFVTSWTPDVKSSEPTSPRGCWRWRAEDP